MHATIQEHSFDIDATGPAYPALDRAVRLARSCGAKLMIADVLTIPADARRSLRADVEEKLVSRQRQQLTRVARGVTGVPTDSTVSPITGGGMPSRAASREPARTTSSAPTINGARPSTNHPSAIIEIERNSFRER
jgi:hypothetical protein